jgi:hypothetical protein
MIQLGEVVKQFDDVVAVSIVNPNLPGSDTLRLNDPELVIQGVNDNGIDIPEDEKQGGVLDEAPPGFPHKLSFPQPVYENAHGNNEKYMGELMRINAFDPPVSLGSQRIGRYQPKPG